LLGDRPETWQVENASQLDLHHVGLVHRAADGTVMTCWLDQLPAQSTASLSVVPAAEEQGLWLEQWGPRDVEQTGPAAEQQVAADPPDEQEGEQQAGEQQAGESTREVTADLRELTRRAVGGMRLRPGDVRLVGWIDGFLPGLVIEPRASQIEASGIVLVHLRQGALPPPRPDENVSADVREEDVDREERTLEIMPADELPAEPPDA